MALSVDGRRGTAIYSVRGRASTEMLKARIGNLGRVAVRFRPIGKPRRIEPPKGCKGEDQLRQRGIFVGTIVFRGEAGYTRVRRNRARGSTATSPRWHCRPRRSGGRNPRGESEFAGLTLGLPTLAAFTRDSHTLFTAMGEDEPGDFDLIFFLAGTTERRGLLRIDRLTLVLGKGGAFTVEDDLGAATVDPPKPFSGTASFVRNVDGSTGWSGPLTVSLPGAPRVALVGPDFTADLARPKTSRELADLFGQPSLARLR